MKKILRLVLLLTAISAMAIAAFAADKRPITAQDLWALKRLGSPVLSPDGTSVVFTVQEWSVEKNKSTSNLWLVEVATGKLRRLTRANASDGSPVWSPDGARIAFISKRGEDETGGLYVIDPRGGEAEKIVELPYGITTPKWMPDSKRLVAATRVIPELVGKFSKRDQAAMRKEIKRRKDSKMTAQVTEHRQYRYWDHALTDNLAHRLLVVNVETKVLADLTPKWDRLFSSSGEATFDVAPDGKQVAVAINSVEPPYRERPNSDIYLISTDGSGGMKNLTADNRATDDGPRFSPDGKSIVFHRQVGSLPYSGEHQRLWRHDLATGKNLPITQALDYSFDEYQFSSDGRSLWLLTEERGLLPVFRMNPDGTGFTKVHGEGTNTGLDTARDVVVFLNETFNRPPRALCLGCENRQGAAVDAL